MTVEIQNLVSDRVRLGMVQAQPVKIGPSSPELWEEITAQTQKLKEAHTGKAPAQIPGLQAARELYRHFGVDPTRTRPSSEALLRRILKGKPFPRILNAVDVCNLLSIEFLLPLGLYDVDKIQDQVVLRQGLAQESFPGIRKEQVNLEGRLVLADAKGPFGNPSSDSARTQVTGETYELLLTIFAPQSVSAQRMHQHLERAHELIQRFLVMEGAGADIKTVLL